MDHAGRYPVVFYSMAHYVHARYPERNSRDQPGLLARNMNACAALTICRNDSVLTEILRRGCGCRQEESLPWRSNGRDYNVIVIPALFSTEDGADHQRSDTLSFHVMAKARTAPGMTFRRSKSVFRLFTVPSGNTGPQVPGRICFHIGIQRLRVSRRTHVPVNSLNM